MDNFRRTAVVKRTILLLLLFALGATFCAAETEGQLVTQLPDPAALRFETRVQAPVWLLTVSGPEDIYIRRSFRGSAPTLDLAEYLGSTPVDGTYVWELRASWPAKKATEGQQKIEARQEVQSGAFRILDGVLMQTDDSAIELELATIVHNDDVVVKGRMCIGDDCGDSELMIFEAVKLKQNNAWIRFNDTSSEPGFATNDWQLHVNDSSSGGVDYFALEDITNSTVPVKIDAGAATDSIRVDQNGRVGLGTATPSSQLHVAGNTFLDGDLTVTSSRTAKTNFDPVDAAWILNGLEQLPLNRWTYLTDVSRARHLGPFAEDFYSTFGLGRSETTVNPLDLAGVAMAAAQGLQTRLKELQEHAALQQAEIASLRRDRDAVLERLEALEARLAESE